MKVLTVNNYHYRRGGAEVCYLDFNKILQQHGHTVTTFSMQMPANIPSEWEGFFVNEIEYENLGAVGKLTNALKIIYSFEARAKLKKLLDNTKPEIVHLHNIYHHLSPSILNLIKKHKLPIIMTLHDLKLLCPNYKMLRNGKVCELCKNGGFYNAAIYKCLKGSLPLSVLIAIEMYIYRLLKTYEKVDLFITPSQFLRKKFIEYGFNPDKVTYIPNFVQLNRYRPDFDSGDYILYLGRLSTEKGIDTLLSAMSALRNLPLKIVGNGPEETRIEGVIRERALTNVELLGYKSGNELVSIIRKAMFLLLPSECYENAPLCILEAFACGKPVIGADIGGIPELVNNGENGLLFTPGQTADLQEKISFLASKPNLIKKMGKNARDFVEKQFSPQIYYQRMLALYEKQISSI